MKTRARAEVFAAKVDQMLARQGKGERPAVISLEESRDLELAERLSSVDLSSESLVLGALPASLDRRVVAESRGKRILRFALRPMPLTVGVLLFALGVMQCTYPGGVPALSKDVSVSISRLVRSELQVGPHTVAQQSTGDHEALKEAVDAIPQETKDRMWYVYAGGIGFGGGTQVGVPPVALELGTVDAARAKAAFTFTTPGYLPPGTELSKVYVAPAGEQVILLYAVPGESAFAISETFVSTEASPSSSSFTTTSLSFISDSPYSQTEVGTSTAAWYEGRALVWERGGISYALGVPGMSEQEAKRIAVSLR